MKRVEGTSGIKLIECVSPARNRWRIRWDVQEREDGSASYMEEGFVGRPHMDTIKSVSYTHLVYLDHYLKDRYAVRHFYRYCDDGVVLGKTQAELWKIRDAVHGRMECAGLLVKGNERVFQQGEGIDFLGYVTFGADHVRPVSYTHLDVYKRQSLASARFHTIITMTYNNKKGGITYGTYRIGENGT